MLRRVVSNDAGGRNGLLYCWISVGVIVLDQLTKAAVQANLRLYQSIVVLPVLEITRVYNRGAAFSFLNDASGWQRWLFAALAVIVSIALILWLKRIDRRARLLGTAIAFVLGGAVGNLIDRLRLGHVVDFVNAHWEQHYFPAFNVADSAITVGAILLVLDAWREAR